MLVMLAYVNVTAAGYFLLMELDSGVIERPSVTAGEPLGSPDGHRAAAGRSPRSRSRQESPLKRQVSHVFWPAVAHAVQAGPLGESPAARARSGAGWDPVAS